MYAIRLCAGVCVCSPVYCADCWSCRPPELDLSVKPQMIKVNVELEWIERTASEFHRRASCFFYLYVTSWMLISSYVALSLQIFCNLILSCLIMLTNPVNVPTMCLSSVKNKKPNNHLQVIFVKHVGRIALPAGRDEVESKREKLKKLLDHIKRAALSTSLSGPELAFQLTPAEC